MVMHEFTLYMAYMHKRQERACSNGCDAFSCMHACSQSWWGCVQWARGQSERGVNSPIVILSSCEKHTLDSMVDSIREETGLDIQAREGRPESADDLKMVSAQDAHNIIIMCEPCHPQYSVNCACDDVFLAAHLLIRCQRTCAHRATHAYCHGAHTQLPKAQGSETVHETPSVVVIPGLQAFHSTTAVSCMRITQCVLAGIQTLATLAGARCAPLSIMPCSCYTEQTSLFESSFRTLHVKFE